MKKKILITVFSIIGLIVSQLAAMPFIYIRLSKTLPAKCMNKFSTILPNQNLT